MKIVTWNCNGAFIWDTWDRWWNHTDVVNILNNSGIVSMYHHLTGEEHGKESKKTFFLQRNIAKAYHIDYVFCPTDLTGPMASLQALDFDEWKHLSDHVPVMFESNVCKAIPAMNF